MAKYISSDGDQVEAVQYIASAKTLPEGVFVKTVVDKESTTDEKTGKEEVEEVEREKAFIKTKDPFGDMNIDKQASSIADGTWIITHEDGEVSLAHPSVFEKEYKEAK